MPPNGFVTIPAGSKPVPCTGASLGGTCTRMIYWSVDPTTGRRMPVDCDVAGGRRPSEARDKSQLDLLSGSVEVWDGKGQPHKRSCPDWGRIVADYHRRNATDVPARKRA